MTQRIDLPTDGDGLNTIAKARALTRDEVRQIFAVAQQLTH
ncbi:MAG TPA: hypothetical protein VMS32_02415 [Verrucomicrobiae bacterium]|nr:hypothetical protein [Verrucomicrobiae bacterium]